VCDGIDVNGVLPAKSKSSVPVILTASRFWPQKDHYTALKAIKELAGQGKKFSYVLAGYGVQEGEIRQWITDLGLGKFVHLLISPANLAALFNQASVYLSTSVREGLSNSIMEAMAAALPVVATNVGDNKYLINDGENGFLTDVGDYKKLSECLSDLLDNEQRRFKMGKSGYEKLVTRFSSRHFLDCYLALVKESVNT
jgi:glycosyltransferase involved in cell wall biosynthesis